jgi:transaldolase/glucose-6-phosphate isomerase
VNVQVAAGLRPRVEARLRAFDEAAVGRRLWDRDAALWKSDPAHVKVIENALGWLSVAQEVREELPDLLAFAAEVAGEGYTDAVLLGMGGSSLAPEVMAFAFGSADGYLELTVLDTTDPAAIAALDERIDLETTLFIVSSKSGGTTETASLHAYFHEKLRALAGDEEAGRHFVAVTDEGTSLELTALDQHFRAVFINPSDIGGRYSALSFFGLVPAALIGADLDELLGRALAMAEECGADMPAAENPGLVFGAALGELALAGRDKLTIVTSPAVGNFGSWAEQLVAESTGKEGKGMLPVAGEPLGAPSAYGDDRAFVQVRMVDGAEGGDALQDRALRELEAAGFPVLRLTLENAYDMGAQFFVWEVAVAVAGSLIGIDPFDQPNVQESKDNTRHVLSLLAEEGEVPLPTGPGGRAVAFACGDDGLEPALRDFLADLAPPFYIALHAWLTPGHEAWLELQAMRELLRDARRAATTEGFGPRFLHSTGQYHKGGPQRGFFLQLVSEDGPHLPVPGERYTFGTLKHAQALGDLQALLDHGGRVLRVDVGDEPVTGLAAFRELLTRVLGA